MGNGMDWDWTYHLDWKLLQFGFVPYMFRHKNGMELELEMYLKLDGNLDLKLVHGYWI
jgi:hypothetical protein